MAKHEYEVRIVYEEIHSMFVEAEDCEEAVKMAEEKYYNGDTDVLRSGKHTEISRLDEEDEED